MHEWMNECMNEWMHNNASMNECMTKKMDGWINHI